MRGACQDYSLGSTGSLHMVPAFSQLRDWLPFPTTREGEDNEAALHHWLEHHTDLPATARAAELAKRLPIIANREKNLHRRIRTLESFLVPAEDILAKLEQAITDAPLPLAPAIRLNAVAADNLLKSLVGSYGYTATAIESRRLATGLGRLLQTALFQGMRLIARRQVLAYRLYAPPSASSWQQMHQLFALARRRELLAPGKHGENIEGVYTRSLLLALADPLRHPREDLGKINTYIDALAPSVKLVRLGDLDLQLRQPGALFLISETHGLPERFLAKRNIATTNDSWLIDTAAVVARLRQATLDRSRKDRSPQLETALANIWNGKPARRFSRAKSKPKAELVTGLAAVAEFLQAAFSRRRNDRLRSIPFEQRASEWCILDQSPDGFGIRHTQGEVGMLNVGDIVGLRPREHNRVQICLIRRVNNTSQGHLELGLQALSPLALPISLEIGSSILLPRLPGFGNCAGLAAPAGALCAGEAIHWHRNGRRFTHHLSHRIDGNGQNDLFLLE